MYHRLKKLLFSVCVLLQAACGSQAVYKGENFSTDSPFKMRTDGEVALACESARRALLGQGYMIDSASGEAVKGRKAYKNENAQNAYIEMNVVCLPEDGGSTLFANGLLSAYELKKSASSASVGVSALGSISLPIGQSADSLVKVSEETIDDKEFYRRFFAAIQIIIKEMQASGKSPASRLEPGSEPAPPKPPQGVAPAVAAPSPVQAQPAVVEPPAPAPPLAAPMVSATPPAGIEPPAPTPPPETPAVVVPAPVQGEPVVPGPPQAAAPTIAVPPTVEQEPAVAPGAFPQPTEPEPAEPRWNPDSGMPTPAPYPAQGISPVPGQSPEPRGAAQPELAPIRVTARARPAAVPVREVPAAVSPQPAPGEESEPDPDLLKQAPETAPDSLPDSQHDLF